MVSVMKEDCPCCQSAVRRVAEILAECKQNGMEAAEIIKEIETTDFDHCKDCWNKYHHGERDKDYEERGRFSCQQRN